MSEHKKETLTGHARFSRKLQTADYENAEEEVLVPFTIEEGDEDSKIRAKVRRAQKIAHEEVNRKLEQETGRLLLKESKESGQPWYVRE